MKKIFLITLTLVAIVSCKKETATVAENDGVETVQKKETEVVADAQKVDLKIEGMTCAIGCAKTIESKLNSLEGVQKATVNFDTKTASIAFDGTIQSVASLTKTIEGVADGKTYKVVR
ncbi:cation transporter [Flavobacterium sp.]|uniref:cation transporter n=1 Tax=Flavobacterium sp. TaxID=239 RepID=UPI003D0A30E9